MGEAFEIRFGLAQSNRIGRQNTRLGLRKSG